MSSLELDPESETSTHGGRREFLRGALVVGCVLAGGRALAFGTRFPMVIKGARAHIDGRWSTPDIAVTEEGRLVLSNGELQGELILDARGKVVSPGFIDVLADNRKGHREVFERYKLTDGVTTPLEMHGGTAEARRYYAEHGREAHWTNYGASAFATLARSQAGTVEERLRRLEGCLQDGALGVSYAIEYLPAPYKELLEYAKLAKRYGRPLFLHLRYSSEKQELAGVQEALQLARECGARIHIDHLHSTGGTYHMSEALAMIREANRSGLEITCCVYPYSYWATYPASERFAPGWQERYGITYRDLRLVGSGERLTEASFQRYRKNYNALVAVPEGTMPLDRTVDLALKEDFCLVASDGGIEGEPRANSHPRGAGCFATALRHGLDMGLPLENILKKMTTLPRKLLRPALDARGILADGAVADLCIFDPASVRSPASVENPNQYSLGIETVIVHGRLAYHKGKLITKNGKPLKAF